MPAIILYLVGFIRTVLIILALYFLIRFLTKIFTQSNSESRKKDVPENGDTTIRFNKKGEKKYKKDEGEYVEFEEVED